MKLTTIIAATACTLFICSSVGAASSSSSASSSSAASVASKSASSEASSTKELSILLDLVRNSHDIAQSPLMKATIASFHEVWRPDETSDDIKKRIVQCRNKTYKYTLAHLATIHQQASLLTALLACGVDANRQNRDGYTILHYLVTQYTGRQVRTGEIEMMHRVKLQALEDGRFNVSAQAKCGNTPLHVATSSRDIEALVQAGACRYIRNKSGFTPLEFRVAKALDRQVHYKLKVELGKSDVTELLETNCSCHSLPKTDDSPK